MSPKRLSIKQFPNLEFILTIENTFSVNSKVYCFEIIERFDVKSCLDTNHSFKNSIFNVRKLYKVPQGSVDSLIKTTTEFFDNSFEEFLEKVKN